MTPNDERPEPHGPGPLHEDRTLAPAECRCGVLCRAVGCVEPPVARLGRVHYCRTHLNAFLGPIEHRVRCRENGLPLDVHLGRLRYVRPAAAWPSEWAWLRCDDPRCGYECVEKWLVERICHRCVVRARLTA